LNRFFIIPLALVFIFVIAYVNQNAFASPFFSNGSFTENGIEWCQENLPLYEILGDKFFDHHKHSLESRVCVSLYHDYFWTYEGPDRIKKLIERSRNYSQLEILESYEESKTGIIDTLPAGNKDQTLLRGSTEEGEITVQIISSSPIVNQSMEINLSFLDQNNKLIPFVNYGIKIKQQDKEILENKNIFSEKGLSSLITRPLNSVDPVVIDISINGIGTSKNPEEWAGPRGEMIFFTIIPEFGTIVIMVFALTITTVIILNRVKNRIPFNLNSNLN
jgi:predicted secreted protein with PEFG-CTERM motif